MSAKRGKLKHRLENMQKRVTAGRPVIVRCRVDIAGSGKPVLTVVESDRPLFEAVVAANRVPSEGQ